MNRRERKLLPAMTRLSVPAVPSSAIRSAARKGPDDLDVVVGREWCVVPVPARHDRAIPRDGRPAAVAVDPLCGEQRRHGGSLDSLGFAVDAQRYAHVLLQSVFM